jgi:DNA adenine methylase
VGGKRELIPQYEPYLPAAYKRYFEPFLGGGAMFWHLRPVAAALSDSNPELIATYCGVRDEPARVIELLSALKARHSKEFYLQVRELDREQVWLEQPLADVAARMIYLNQTCFNALYRVNRQGQFNVPIGSSLDRAICEPQTIELASAALQAVTLEVADFANAVSSAGPSDFVYLDPPYVPLGGHADFDRYTKETFRFNDHVRLRDGVRELRDRGCLVMLSNSDTPLTRELYAEFFCYTVRSVRTLNSKKERRGAVAELLVTTYPTEVAE